MGVEARTYEGYVILTISESDKCIYYVRDLTEGYSKEEEAEQAIDLRIAEIKRKYNLLP